MLYRTDDYTQSKKKKKTISKYRVAFRLNKSAWHNMRDPEMTSLLLEPYINYTYTASVLKQKLNGRVGL